MQVGRAHRCSLLQDFVFFEGAVFLVDALQDRQGHAGDADADDDRRQHQDVRQGVDDGRCVDAPGQGLVLVDDRDAAALLDPG